MTRDDVILLDHGSGGRATRQLVEHVFVPLFDNPLLRRMDDSAEIGVPGARLAFTTDAFVVDPIFFPGGDIGMLAVNGTVNDLAMGGAVPLFLSAALILEEGLPTHDLECVVRSMADAARHAGVQIVAGDTKVVPRGSADKIFITTAGVGRIPDGVEVSGHLGRPGDQVVLSGPIGAHEITILSQRAGFDFASTCRTDSAPLGGLVSDMLAACRGIHSLRDPTRGGLAATLNELAQQSRVRIEIDESELVIDDDVQSACDLLGLDPMHLANEGVLVALVPADGVAEVMRAAQAHAVGSRARVIGSVHEGPPVVVLRTRMGGRRIVSTPTGGPLPRIC